MGQRDYRRGDPVPHLGPFQKDRQHTDFTSERLWLARHHRQYPSVFTVIKESGVWANGNSDDRERRRVGVRGHCGTSPTLPTIRWVKEVLRQNKCWNLFFFSKRNWIFYLTHILPSCCHFQIPYIFQDIFKQCLHYFHCRYISQGLCLVLYLTVH